MNATTSARTTLMVLVAIGFGIARAGEVHAPSCDGSAWIPIDALDVPHDRYLDLGAPFAADDSPDYETVQLPWQVERHELADVVEESRYVDLGALHFSRSAALAPLASASPRD